MTIQFGFMGEGQSVASLPSSWWEGKYNKELITPSLLDEVWLGCGERQGAKVCVINCEQEKLRLEVPLTEVSLICCLVTIVLVCYNMKAIIVNTLSVALRLNILCTVQ